MRYNLNTDVCKGIKEFSKSLTEDFLVYLNKMGYITKITNHRRQIANVAMRVFINNCYESAIVYKNILVVPLDNSVYSKGFIMNGVEKKREKVSRQYTRWLLDFMQDTGFGTYELGNREYESHIINNKYELVINDTVTKFKMFDTFYEELRSEKENIGFIPKNNVISLRDVNGLPVPFKLSNHMKKMATILKDMNKQHSETIIGKQTDDSYDIRVQLEKIYNVTKERGGKVYTDIQRMPKKERKLLTIEKEPVVCLDYKCFETSLLYSLQGELLKGDPYQVEIQGFDSKLLRDIGKMVMTRIYYCEDEFQLRSSVNFDISKDYDLDKLVDDGKIPTPRIPVSFIIKELMKRHYCISGYFFRKSETDPAYIGSLVIDYVIDFLNQNHNMLIIPVFDEIICKETNRDLVLNVMREGFSFVVGTELNCNIEEG